MADKVLLAQQDGILTLTLNWPETRNALTDDALLDPLGEALTRIARDASVRVETLRMCNSGAAPLRATAMIFVRAIAMGCNAFHACFTS